WTVGQGVTTTQVVTARLTKPAARVDVAMASEAGPANLGDRIKPTTSTFERVGADAPLRITLTLTTKEDDVGTYRGTVILRVDNVSTSLPIALTIAPECLELCATAMSVQVPPKGYRVPVAVPSDQTLPARDANYGYRVFAHAKSATALLRIELWDKGVFHS